MQSVINFQPVIEKLSNDEEQGLTADIVRRKIMLKAPGILITVRNASRLFSSSLGVSLH